MRCCLCSRFVEQAVRADITLNEEDSEIPRFTHEANSLESFVYTNQENALTPILLFGEPAYDRQLEVFAPAGFENG